MPPAHDGIPTALGVWSGDFSSVVSQEQEVVPAAGTRATVPAAPLVLDGGTMALPPW